MKRMMKACIVVFALMVLCTLVSRGVRTAVQPRVQTVAPKAGVITDLVEAQGEVIGNTVSVVPALSGLVVSTVFVVEGEYVSEDSPICQYDQSSMEKQLKLLLDDRETICLQIKETEDAENAAKQQQDLEYQNAKSDLERITAEQNRLVSEALTNWEKKQQEGADQEEVDAAEEAYETAIRERETEVETARRQVELAELPSVESTSAQQLEIAKEQKDEEIRKLQQLVEEDGKVYAGMCGTVREVLVQSGVSVGGETAAVIAQDGGNKTVEVTTDEETAKGMWIGQEVSVSGNIQGEEIEAISTVIAKDKSSEDETWKITLDVSDSEFPLGETVCARLVDSAENYLSILPRSALRQESGNTYFVYLLQEKESILGTELRMERRDVEVLDMDTMNVAVEGVTTMEQVVYDSDRMLSEGCRVRLSEDE